MGQNMVGWCAIKIDEAEGKEVTIRYGEMLTEDGQLYTENLRRATQTDRYIADGEGAHVFEPRFTYHGFRYVGITGMSKKPTLETVVGKAVSSDINFASRFECSNKYLNQLWKNFVWTQRDNLIGIPTDCPQRDERLGWMADAQVFSQTAIYNADMAAFLTKWTQDIRDAQHQDGRYPDVAPIPSCLNFYNAPAWADAGLVIPWRVYQNDGDIRILKKHFSSAKRFIDFVHSKNPNLIWTEAVGNQYGDWLNGNTIVADDYPKTGGQVPHNVFNTMNFVLSTQILSNMAKVLDYEHESKCYAELAADIRNAFLKEFVGRQAYMTGNTQAGYALALGFELFPDSLRAKAIDHMLSCIADYDFRISTGFVSTIRLMHELVRWGYADIAYQLLESHRFPSWLYQIDQGATTVWERWDGYVKGRGFQDPGMNSFNHYAIGSVGEWLYVNILGIQRDEDHPGYKEFIIRPQIGGSLTWANGKYHSIYGDIVSEWRIQNGSLQMHVEVPANTRARVYIPTKNVNTIKEGNMSAERSAGVKFLSMEGDAAIYEVLSGCYDFVSEYSREELPPYAARPKINYAKTLDGRGNLQISIKPPYPECKIFYSLNGSEPEKIYTEPFFINQNAVVSARTLREGMRPSFQTVTSFVFTEDSLDEKDFPHMIRTHKGFGKSVQYTHSYSSRYSGEGALGLVNGKFGDRDHLSLEWQGFEEVDFEAVVDLGTAMSIRMISVNFLNNQNARIFLPMSVEFSLSENGKDYVLVATAKNEVEQDYRDFVRTVKREFPSRRGRYVKISARNVETCPNWHPAKGRYAWLFVDEIVIE